MSATAALEWVGRLTGLATATLATQAEALVAAGGHADAPVFLPCLNGIRTPLNRPEAQGRIEGLHPGVKPAALGYATMEGVALQFEACVEAQRAVGVRPKRFLAVGGGTRSALWTRLLATVLDQPVSLPEGADMAGPAGAARLALVAAGHDVAMLSRPRDIHTTVDPDPVLARILAPRTARFGMLLAAGA